MTHWNRNILFVCRLSYHLFLQAILNVVLGPFFIVFLFIDKVYLYGIFHLIVLLEAHCTASGVMRSDAAASERTRLLVFR